MSDLATFLLARIAADEDMARLMAEMMGGNIERLAGFASPGRVLAECDAKRQIVEMEVASATSEIWDINFSPDSSDVLRLLAAVYADHPDYREEWRP